MLVIIVSLGFGIVKPRLGPTLHRVVGIGGLYFALASTEAYLRVMKPKNDVSTGTLLAGIPLAVIDRYAVGGRFTEYEWGLFHPPDKKYNLSLLALYVGGCSVHWYKQQEHCD